MHTSQQRLTTGTMEPWHYYVSGPPAIGANVVPVVMLIVLLGAVIGGMLGYRWGTGAILIPGLAMFVSGGAGVTTFIGACLLASVFGLAAGLVAILAYPAPSRNAQRLREDEDEDESESGEHAPHRMPAYVRWLPLAGIVVLALFMAYTLYDIASAGLGRGHPSPQENRVTWNQKNAARIGDIFDQRTLSYAIQVAYPGTRPENSAGLIVDAGDRWQAALAAAPLIAKPINAAVLHGNASRLNFPANTPREDASALDPISAAAAVDARLAETGAPATDLIIVAADGDPRWALPAAAYAARTGTPILFATGNGIPEPTARALAMRNGSARIFVLAPGSVLPAAVLSELQRYGTVTRIAAGNFAEHAVRFAQFSSGTFGWGLTGDAPSRFANFNAILVNEARWQDAIAGAHLARAGRSGPLLYTGKDRLPPATDYYLWTRRPVFEDTPAEGPFNHVWAVGSFEQISYPVQAWADYSQEIEQYMTLGHSAVSGFEAFGIGWLMLSVASAIWVAVHAFVRMPSVAPLMKYAWILFTLLLGPVAVWLYINSYHRRPLVMQHGMAVWQRPPGGAAVSATVMMFGFDMMLMVLAVFALAYLGFPIWRFISPFYWVGTSMFLMMVLMYVVAFVLMMLVFHTPMTMHHRGISSYWKAFAVGRPIMAATMTVESLGMMPTMWWAQMLFLPAMQMPTEDDVTMWTTLFIAVAVGFLIVLPFNYWLVRRGIKQGTM